jgi:hypothetical protein
MDRYARSWMFFLQTLVCTSERTPHAPSLMLQVAGRGYAELLRNPNMRTSENSVSANFGEGEVSVSRNELARRHGTGVVNRTVREHEGGPTPPPRSAGPPRSRIVSEGPGPVHAPFGPFRPERERRGARKSPAAQEGGIRAAGPDGYLLPGRERGRRSSAASAKRTSQTPVEAKFAEFLFHALR